MDFKRFYKTWKTKITESTNTKTDRYFEKKYERKCSNVIINFLHAIISKVYHCLYNILVPRNTKFFS